MGTKGNVDDSTNGKISNELNEIKSDKHEKDDVNVNFEETQIKGTDEHVNNPLIEHPGRVPEEAIRNKNGSVTNVHAIKWSWFPKYLPIMVFQIILLILFFKFVQYGGSKNHNIAGFEDIHIMIFIGFAFLMTFLKRYCYSALGINFMLAALAVQWAILCQNFFKLDNGVIYITKKHLVEADVMSATVLITFGALLGYTTPIQLLYISIIEVALGCVNIYLVADYFKAADIGGSIAIHTFGAYFGLGVSMALGFKRKQETSDTSLNSASYSSDVTAMIGTLFLFVFWPSFNAALAVTDSEYQRAIINTYLAIVAATVTTFVLSSIVNHEKGKFDMVHIQNATLAGGVGVGSVANMFISCGGAIAIGIGAGVLSVCGYKYLTPLLEKKLNLRDTCGVNNLHGMPGVYSGILSVIFAACASTEYYGNELKNVFPAMNPVADGTNRIAKDQAIQQLLALIVTIVIALFGGLITGFISRIKLFRGESGKSYDDEPNWELP